MLWSLQKCFLLVASGSYSIVSPCLWVTAPWLVFSLLPYVYLPQSPLRTVCTGYNGNEEDKSNQHRSHPSARVREGMVWGRLLSSLCRLNHTAGGIQWAGCSLTVNGSVQNRQPAQDLNWLQDSLNTTLLFPSAFLSQSSCPTIRGRWFHKS